MRRAPYPPPADVHERTADYRRLFADTVADLSGEQWHSPTLCAGWDVHTLTAHLLQARHVNYLTFLWKAIRYRGDTDRVVDEVTRRIARAPTTELIRELRTTAQDRLDPPQVGPMGPYADICVHLRDLARPLGLDVDVEPLDWRRVLDYLTTPGANRSMAPPGRLDGLAFVATDQEWRAGEGTELRGPAEALAMATSGRRVALADLDGPGVPLLADRLSSTSTAS